MQIAWDCYVSSFSVLNLDMASLASFRPQGGTVFLIQETSCRLWRAITITFVKTIVWSLYTFDFIDLLLCEYISHTARTINMAPY